MEGPEPDFFEEFPEPDEERFLEGLEALELEDFLLEEPDEERFFFVEEDEEDPGWLLRKRSFFWASVNSARSGASMTPAERIRDSAPRQEMRYGFGGTRFKVPVAG